MTDELRKFGGLSIKLNPDAVKVLTGSVDNILAAFAVMGEIFANVFLGFEQLRQSMPPIPEYHSFRPDYDLRCTVKHCNLLPEEH